MILADKIVRLRKKNGLSQEELAEKMNVSRQAISKWEGAQTVPDLEKILQLASIFGVSTDYLLKDEIEDGDNVEQLHKTGIKRISSEEVDTYLQVRKRASWQIALAVFLCILSPLALIILSTFSELNLIGLNQSISEMIGLGTLFIFVLCAVPIFIMCGFKNTPYEFLDNNDAFELECGALEFVRKCKCKFAKSSDKLNVIATCICIASPVPLIMTAFLENEVLTVLMLAWMMVSAGVGVGIFIMVGIQKASMDKLLSEGEYTPTKKKRSRLKETVGLAYWGIATAVYLAVSFSLDAWKNSFLIFAIAGILFPFVMSVCDRIADKNN